MSEYQTSSMDSSSQNVTHPLYDKWTLWAHLPHDTDWSLKSYKPIMTMKTLEDALALNRALPEKLVKNCMLFLMRKGISPTWEDPKNRQGGCFSFKIKNSAVPVIWKRLSYALVGETITNDNKLLSTITGITISPKKSFCIIKVWLSNCNMQSPHLLSEIPGLTVTGCIFKKHKPEY
jgi:hypothetical protein